MLVQSVCDDFSNGVTNLPTFKYLFNVKVKFGNLGFGRFFADSGNLARLGNPEAVAGSD